MCWKRKTFLVFESSRIQKGLGQLGAVFPESKIITLIVLRFRILSFSTANTTARCHTSKRRILTHCNFFSRIFYCNRHTLSIIHVVYDVILTRWEIWPSKESACTELLKASLTGGNTGAISINFLWETPSIRNFVHYFCGHFVFELLMNCAKKKNNWYFICVGPVPRIPYSWHRTGNVPFI